MGSPIHHSDNMQRLWSRLPPISLSTSISLPPLIESLSAACVVNFDQSSYTVDEGNVLEVMVAVDLRGSIEDFTVNISSINGTAGIAIVDDLFG